MVMPNPYPPLAPVEDAPIHGQALPKRGWWACSFPERIIDDDIFYDWRCHACTQVAYIDIVRAGDRPTVWNPGATDGSLPESKVVQLSWLVNRATYWSGKT